MQMKCVQVREIGNFRLTKVALRKPLDHEVVIRVSVTGLCRTDLKLIRVGHRDLVLPFIPGEEVVGTVSEIGSAVAGVQTGDLVYVYPGSWCENCSACANVAENLCREMESWASTGTADLPNMLLYHPKVLSLFPGASIPIKPFLQNHCHAA